jgi:hypothetical protein
MRGDERDDLLGVARAVRSPVMVTSTVERASSGYD